MFYKGGYSTPQAVVAVPPTALIIMSRHFFNVVKPEESRMLDITHNLTRHRLSARTVNIRSVVADLNDDSQRGLLGQKALSADPTRVDACLCGSWDQDLGGVNPFRCPIDIGPSLRPHIL